MEKIIAYGRIVKVDIRTGIVEGVAMDETPDHDGEIYDYNSSKPYVIAWSNKSAETTKAAGQEVSYGTLRSMHSGKVAAGRLNAIEFDDAAKAVRIAAEVVDKDELAKCYKGVYKGFSVAGAALEKWRDGQYTRYTVDPLEISLVDAPCNPGAMFTAVKADGTSEERQFQPQPATISESRVVALIEAAIAKFKIPPTAKEAADMDETQKLAADAELAKAAATTKLKAAQKAHNEVGACLGGYCDHGSDTEKCMEKADQAHEANSEVFGDDEDEGKKKAKKVAKAETADADAITKAAAIEAENSAKLQAEVEKLTAEIAELKKFERAKPILHGRVVAKADDNGTTDAITKAAAIDSKDPNALTKSAQAIFESAPVIVE